MDKYPLLRTCLSGEPKHLNRRITPMLKKQYSRQVQKRKRIGNRTLVVGIDIGSAFNAACFMDKEGNVLPPLLTIGLPLKLRSELYLTLRTEAKRKSNHCEPRCWLCSQRFSQTNTTSPLPDEMCERTRKSRFHTFGYAREVDCVMHLHRRWREDFLK